jgi:hypothetical protein
MFYSTRNGKCKIKKPKLELGNIPTGWSASPYDVDYKTLLGMNLLEEVSLVRTINYKEEP